MNTITCRRLPNARPAESEPRPPVGPNSLGPLPGLNVGHWGNLAMLVDEHPCVGVGADGTGFRMPGRIARIVLRATRSRTESPPPEYCPTEMVRAAIVGAYYGLCRQWLDRFTPAGVLPCPVCWGRWGPHDQDHHCRACNGTGWFTSRGNVAATIAQLITWTTQPAEPAEPVEPE